MRMLPLTVLEYPVVVVDLEFPDVLDGRLDRFVFGLGADLDNGFEPDGPDVDHCHASPSSLDCCEPSAIRQFDF